MKIIIVGVGKIGYAIAQQLEGEDHDITVVDRDLSALERGETLDVMCVEGNGASVSTLLQAGVRGVDLVIAVTADDEANLICCLLAKKLGAQHTVARVRDPEYFRDAPILRQEIGLDLIINPEYASAQEISRILRVPSAFSVESFAGGAVELIGFQVAESDGLAGHTLIELNRKSPNSLLLCAARRGSEVIVPNGGFTPRAGDLVYAIGTPGETQRVLRGMGRPTAPLRRISVLGGSRIAQYLAWELQPLGTKLCILERSREKCLMLAEKLPQCSIIEGDGTDHELLDAEGILDTDAVVCVTGSDEENLLMALTALHAGVKKVIPKMSHMGYSKVVEDMKVESVISLTDVTAGQISSYVRGIANSQGSAVESLYKILGGAIEAVEFTATSATHFLDTPLRDLHLRQGLLVAAIVHEGKMLIPGGGSRICAGDRVIVVARRLFLRDLNDILES